MNENKDNSKSVSFGKLFILFLLIFIFAVFYISFQTSAKLSEENEKKIESYMAAQLDSFITDTGEEYYVWQNFSQIIETALNKGIESKELSEAISNCFTDKKISAYCFFYKNNIFMKGFNYTDKDLEIFKELSMQLSLDKNTPEFIEVNRKTYNKLENYFGPGNRLELINISKGMLKPFNQAVNKNYYYWNNYPNGISLFLITKEIPDFIERFKTVQSANHNGSMGAISKENKIITPIGFTEDQFLSAFIKSQKSNKAFIEAYNHYCYFQITNNSNKICYVIQKNKNLTGFYNWAALLEAISLILIILISSIYLITIIIKPAKNIIDFLDNLSIKYKIISIISISSVFPAVMSLIIGFSLLSDKEKVIEEAILSESLANISNIENQYKVLQNKAYQLALDIREAVKHTDSYSDLLKKYLDKYSLEEKLSYLEIRDGETNSLLTMHDRETSAVSITMDLICRIVLKLHSPERLNSTKLNISPVELLSEAVLATDELGFSTLLRQRGKQWILRAGPHPTIWYWDVYPELATGPAFLCITFQTNTAFPKTIKDYFDNLHLASDSLELYAAISENLYNPEIQPNKDNLFPQKELLNIADSAFRTNQVLFRTVSIKDKTYWVTAKQEKEVRAHVFMHLINKEERLKVLEPYKWQLIISGIFTLFISLLGAWFIISLVILPVNNLSKGIEAIRYRARDFTIPVTRKDEFGKLALAFNKVIKEFDEMDYGKVVQENLLPPDSPKIDGYDIAYFNISASDLAGDYHDHAILEDGKLTLLLGDVSGHGISASLAMAMAKATFNYAQALKVKFPEEFMEMLNTMFNKELKPRNKLMTMISMVLTPETGEVIFDNSGQAYPAYFTASTQTSEEIKMPSLPLGGMKKRKKKAITKVMEPGDAFIFYSDGIIEASAANGEMFGYERFFSAFTEQMKLNIPANEAIKKIYQAVENFREPGHHSDDITLIIVRRNPVS